MDFLYILIFIAFGFIFINYFKNQLSKNDCRNLRLLWIYHLLITIFFYFITKDGGGDAWTYWKVAKNMTIEDFWYYLFLDKGTYFMYAFNYFPAGILQMSFLANTFFYSLLGFFGIVFFYLVVLKTIPFNSKFGGILLFPTLLFFPNLHFWSAGVGKDTLLFFCVGMFVYGILRVSKRIPLLFFSLLLAFLIRPHIVLFILTAFGFAFLLEKKINKFKRVFFAVFLLGLGIAIFPTVMEFAKIEEASTESFEQFSNHKAELLSQNETGSRMSSSSFPTRVFAFLFRPFFFDINGVPSVIASFENLFLLLISLKLLINKPIKSFRKAPFIVRGLVLFLVIGTIAFSMVLGNVGIMIRMRNMFLPGMLIYILWAFSYRKQCLILKRNINI